MSTSDREEVVSVRTEVNLTITKHKKTRESLTPCTEINSGLQSYDIGCKTLRQLTCETRASLQKDSLLRQMDLPFTIHPEGIHVAHRKLPPIPTGDPQGPLRVALTGAASDIGQALAFMVCRGQAFGPDRHMDLVLVDKHRRMKALREGLLQQIRTSTLPLVVGVSCTSSMAEAFEDAQVIFLCQGIVPSLGVSRTDTININAIEFKEIGLALEKVLSNKIVNEHLKILVVTEPPNINMHVLMHFAPSLNPRFIMGLSRVDQNRGKTCIARRLDIACDKVQRLTVWGNKSNNIFFDLSACVIDVHGSVMPARQAIQDDHWIKHKLYVSVQKRQAEIEKRRGRTLCLPVAAAAAQHMHEWSTGTQPGDWGSCIVASDGSYGVEPGLCYSFPVRVTQGGVWQIVQGLNVDDFMRERLDACQQEIIAERSIAYNELKVTLTEDAPLPPNDWSFGNDTALPCSILKDIELNKIRFSQHAMKPTSAGQRKGQSKKS